MDREDVIRWAREAGLGWVDADVQLERFAKLIAVHTLSNIDPSKLISHQEGFEAGRLAEREACAQVCEAMNTYMDDGEECAKAIRARGNK